MPTPRKRAQSRSRINQAVRAGRKALRSAEKRIPPDLRRQIDRSIKDGQKRFDAVVKDVRSRVSKANAPEEINRALKRFGDFSKQVEGLARSLTARTQSATTARSTRRASATRRTATRKAASTRKATATRKPATARKPATRKAAAARKPASRRPTRRSAAAEAPMVAPMPPAVPGAPIVPMEPGPV